MIDERIRRVLAEHAKIASDLVTLGDHSDLYRAGMSSHATVNVMIALEDEFDVEFPEPMLQRSTFASIAAIRAALTELTTAPLA